MKVVVYHADSPAALYKGSYEKIFKGFMQNIHKFNLEVTHLTLDGHPGWGDINIHFSGLGAQNIVYNREQCFAEYLKTAEEDEYWFAEPDYRLCKVFPPLKKDICLLLRNDKIPLHPSWRLCTQKAYPFFQELADRIKLQPKELWSWYGDSNVFRDMHKEINKWDVELRDYDSYGARQSQYSRNFKGKNKDDIHAFPI